MKATLLARQAVRPWILNSVGPILVGVSGGADSLALAIATKLESIDREVIPVVIDHSLQDNSATFTSEALQKLSLLNFEKVETLRIKVDITDGIEASARRARYAAFDQIATKFSSSVFS